MSISFRAEPNEVSSPTPFLAPVPSNYTDQGVGITFQADYDLVSGHCRNRNCGRESHLADSSGIKCVRFEY